MACTPFSILQNLNQRSPEQKATLQKKIAWGTNVVNHMIELSTYALKLGCELIFEQPAHASSWKSVKALQALRKHLYEVTAAGCAWGRVADTIGVAKKRAVPGAASAAARGGRTVEQCP